MRSLLCSPNHLFESQVGLGNCPICSPLQLDDIIGDVDRRELEVSILDSNLDQSTRRARDKTEITWDLERRSEHSTIMRKDEDDGQTVSDVEGFK